MNRKGIYISLFFIYFFPTFFLGNAKSINYPKDSGLYVSLNIGSVFPMGNFKSFGSGGYAMNGYGGSAAIDYTLKPGWLGLTFESGYYVNSFNLSAFENEKDQNIGPYIVNGVSQYKELPILGGIFFETNLKRVTIRIKSMLGLDFIDVPSVNYYLLPQYGSIWPNLPEPYLGNSNLHDFVCYAGVSLRYELVKHIFLQGNAGYFNSFYNASGYINVSQFQLQLGIVYHF